MTTGPPAPRTPPVAPELFDVLIDYDKHMEQAKAKQPQPITSTSPALEFCENFYAQFFQNRLGNEIRRFNGWLAEKIAVRLTRQVKHQNGPPFVI